MNELGIKQLCKVLLAGAFGNYSDPREVCYLGLFPPVESGLVEGVGNAAGTGAIMALTSKSCRSRSDKLCKQIKYIELSGSSRFQAYFVESMPFPINPEAKEKCHE